MVDKKRNLLNCFKTKRGQVTIFIIIAVLVIVAGVLIYMFTPDIISREKIDLEDPQQYIQSCVSDELEEVTRQVSLQGGSLEPEHSYSYQGNDLEYLCYSSEDYDLCSVQRPFLRTHLEKEIKSGISGQAESCFSSLVEEYEEEGYQTNLKKEEINIKILPKQIAADLNTTLHVQREENVENHRNFEINKRSSLYDIVDVAESIVEWESGYGTADPSLYMNVYYDLLVEKREQSDDTTVYIIENIETGNKFQFASRSLAFPSSYGEPPEDMMAE